MKRTGPVQGPNFFLKKLCRVIWRPTYPSSATCVLAHCCPTCLAALRLFFRRIYPDFPIFPEFSEIWCISCTESKQTLKRAKTQVKKLKKGIYFSDYPVLKDFQVFFFS